jgi:hypothetical protein
MEFPTRELPDGRGLMAVPLTFGRGRLVVMKNLDAMVYDDAW